MIPKVFEKWTHLFSGSYNYKINDTLYATESFDLLMHSDLKDLAYSSESISRAKTGETLKIRTHHVYTEDYKFKEARVEKLLGNQYSKENFLYNSLKGVLHYSFEDYDRKVNSTSVNTSQNFHIQTPDALTTLIFAFARGLNYGDDIIQKIYFAENNWQYEKDLQQNSVIVVKKNKGTKDFIQIKEHKLQAAGFIVYEDEDHERSRQAAPIVFLSSHYGIPYKIVGADNTVIEVDYLNDLREETLKLDS